MEAPRHVEFLSHSSLSLPLFTGHFPPSLPRLPLPPVAMENSSVASASSEAGSTRSQEIEELERFIDSYVLEYQVQGLLGDKADGDLDLDNGGKVPQVRALLHEWMTGFQLVPYLLAAVVMFSCVSDLYQNTLSGCSLHQNSCPYCCNAYVKIDKC